PSDANVRLTTLNSRSIATIRNRIYTENVGTGIFSAKSY
ncbi:MAG: hypothetical protein ACJAXU_002364, partial [Paracoccaceae bacterium]